MKRISLSCCAAMIAISTFAQNPDKALARVRYTFSHIEDTTQRDKPRTENMLLITGNNASVYTSYDKINQSANMQKQIQEQVKAQAGSGMQNIKIESRSTKPISQVDYFFFANEHKMITKERLFNNYLVEEPAETINWKIAKDTMSFSGIHCQKATAYFKGRNWIAWFATEIPFQSGPWKLNGLPGLIVEAYDEKKEVQFQFAGLDKVTEAETVKDEKGELSGMSIKIVGLETDNYLGSEIKLPANAIKTTRKELDKLKEARDKDPQGFMQAQMAANGINGSFKSSTVRAPGSVKIAINNPIELPEKK
ncbi:GLPGLI family protein [Pedobacter punctiformis]|uniref:GLPGLI family protein n=1 Tax=Pedobacter punctiformis TaxID=3004097 RepID=A0ABT4LD20_9SPHI|nr:GLPGLI family protein [Pedobacter sp. HCMS5-2]MCZ4245817.1 GLPGLI family protein [Pedobacter sp. HCMS5-2]